MLKAEQVLMKYRTVLHLADQDTDSRSEPPRPPLDQEN